ncbi:hypothetical protein Ssi03_15440 [Sphaerisporangium siamense]|nr:hypothetical protein Ssi03_15440 [Sphaerisporangium siamense]
MPAGAAVVGLALLIVLGVTAAAALLITRDTARDGAAERTGAARTPLGDVRDLTAPVSPFPALPAGPSSPARVVPSSLDRASASVRLTPPHLIAIVRRALTPAALDGISALRDVRKVAVADAGAIRFSTATLNLLAVDPAEFRAWAPKAVAREPEVWDALARGEFVADSKIAASYLLKLGGEYATGGGSRLRVAAAAPLGLPGVDGLVGKETGRALGLLPGVAVLLHTARGKESAVVPRVRKLLGAEAQVVPVGRAAAARPSASAAPSPPSPPLVAAAGSYRVGRPGSYLELYKIAAARVCPGLSWTVLAAIGQVESGHGRNNGPSSAGALGPMQFMPATWKAYGVDGDGDGTPDIWSPYDAVPSAARYLCANGAAQGGAKLRSAVYRYNHSWAYVDKVLRIADGYARAYS